MILNEKLFLLSRRACISYGIGTQMQIRQNCEAEEIHSGNVLQRQDMPDILYDSW